jgi:hypothetical protein
MGCLLFTAAELEALEQIVREADVAIDRSAFTSASLKM